MALKVKRSLIVLLYVLSTPSAYAQICQESGNNTSGDPKNERVWIKCDNRYRDLSVTCDDNAESGKQSNAGTRPSCPPKPMPMITTPFTSYITNKDGKPAYSPYLFAYARDKTDTNNAYNGVFSTGTGGGPDKIFSLRGNVGSPDQQNKEKATPSIANCKDQIRTPKQFKISTNDSDLEDQAKVERLKFDNCINQYILQDALFPFQKSRARLINNPMDSSAYISLETECQPLKVDQSVANDNEYLISDYVIAAWKKLLKDPDYRYSKTKVEPTLMARAALKRAELSMPDVDKNKHEPHLPDKIKIENPIDPPTDYEEVKPSHLATTEYEDITDPSHPFTPRWDFLFNEREYYSPMTDDYQKKTENAVYCAGVKEAKNESDEKKKANKEVKVDVLAFREKAFTEGIVHRIGFNKICKEDADNNQEQDGEFFSLLFQSYCVKLHPIKMAACLISGSTCDETGTQKPCWKCFKLSGKVDNPPCSTRYDEKDLKVKGALVFPGLKNGFAKKASCNPVYYMRRGKHNIDKLCNNLRKPYTQTNRLKMRYDNPDDTDNNALTAGVQEGFRFTDYFENHMPYPRMFDIGSSLHKSKQTDTQYQQADDTEGQYASIVGIGREGAPKSAGDDAQKKHKDERCMFGGWGGKDKTSSSKLLTGQKEDTKFLGLTINVPDPITSWTEVKAIKMRTMRLTNLSCIGRHEKIFKTGGTENTVLKAAGGEWSNVVVQKCPTNDKDPKNCTYMSLKEYQDANKNKSTTTGDPNNYSIPQQKLENWPLAWRGFIVKGTKGEKDESLNITDNDQFPKFGNTSVTILSGTKGGMWNAQLGDIVLLPHGSAAKDKIPGLAKIALVTEVNLQAPENANKSGPPYVKDCIYDKYKKKDKADCYVQVLEADNGKFPDACGTTDNYGEFKTRYLYYALMLPDPVAKELNSLGSTDDCTDTRLFKCRFYPWWDVTLYRMRDDVRDGCDKEKSKDCS